MENSITQLLTCLNVPISGKYVEKLVKAHPDFPSMLSISDILQRLGINHRVTRIDKEKIHELEYPYLVPLDKGRKDFLVIKNGDTFKKLNEHFNEWSGVVLLAEPVNTTTDQENNALYAKETAINKYSLGMALALLGLLIEV